MNWNNRPELFIGGNFNAKLGDETIEVIVGYSGPHDCFIFGDSMSTWLWDVNDCTLIARRISDMTEEEVKELYPMATTGKGITVLKNHLITEANSDGLLGWEERGLAKIGVYFGPQSHFEDGTVIEAQKETA